MTAKATRRRFAAAADPDVVRARLVARLGAPVEVTMRQPVGAEPGLLVVEDPTGAPIWVAADVVADVLTDAAPPVSSARRCLAELDAADTVEAALRALYDHVQRRCEADELTAARSLARPTASFDAPSPGVNGEQ